MKNMRQIKCYDVVFQVITALTVQNMNLKAKFLQHESFFSFSLKCFDFNCTPRKDTTIYIVWNHLYSSKKFNFEENCLSSITFKEIMRFRNL